MTVLVIVTVKVIDAVKVTVTVVVRATRSIGSWRGPQDPQLSCDKDESGRCLPDQSGTSYFHYNPRLDVFFIL